MFDTRACNGTAYIFLHKIKRVVYCNKCVHTNTQSPYVDMWPGLGILIGAGNTKYYLDKNTV